MKAAFLFVILASVLVIQNEAASVPGCTPEEEAKASDCFRDAVIIGNIEGKGWPVTGKEDYCKHNREMQTCVRDYAKKCLSAFSKQVVGLLARGVGKSEKFLCKKEEDELVAYAKCANTGFPAGHQCMEKLTMDFGRTKEMPEDKRMHTLCCAYYRMKDCVISNVDKKVCTEVMIKDYDTVIMNIGQDIMDLSCSNVGVGSSACPPLLEAIDKMSSKKTYRSVLNPFIAIANEF